VDFGSVEGHGLLTGRLGYARRPVSRPQTLDAPWGGQNQNSYRSTMHILLLSLLLVTAACAAPPAPGFRAGAATSNITPVLGAPIIGGFAPFPSTNVHDELRARCLVLDDGKTRLALVVLDLLGIDKVEYHDRVTLAARYRELPVATRRPSAERLAWAKQTLAKPEPAQGKADLPRIYAQRTVDIVGYPAAIPLPLQVLRIGPVCIGTMSGEPFGETGLEFRRRSPVQPAFLVSLAHGCFGYLPPPRHFELGGYETWLGTNHLEPLASDKMLDALLEMAAEVRPATAE